MPTYNTKCAHVYTQICEIAKEFRNEVSIRLCHNPTHDSNTKCKPNFDPNLDSDPCFKAVKDNYTNSMNQPHESFKFSSLFDVQVGTCGFITSWLYPGAYIEGFDPCEKHLRFSVAS